MKMNGMKSLKRLSAQTLLLMGGLMAGGVALGAKPVAEPPPTDGICPEKMQAIFDEVKTPFKYGMILVPSPGEKYDNPVVYRHRDAWYMLYIRYDGRGYETHLAKSTDLLHWEKKGLVLSRGEKGTWDAEQSDGFPMLLDTTWGGSNELKTYDNRYWLMYIGGAKPGYETDPLSTGVAYTDDPSVPKSWVRWKKNPVLSPMDPDVRPFEKVTLYKHFAVEDPTRALGGRFVDFYNGKNVRAEEQVGIAVSDDMVTWRRYGADAVITDARVGDPMLQRIGDVWVMFYYCYGRTCKGAFDTFACSRDLVHWTKWQGEPLLKPSEPWDSVHAHKPWVIKHNGVVYHFYNAVGNRGRGLALATSVKLDR
ncbi:MAG: glycosylase [Kiritimatiellae bacterium]|nr:glycosylase [Kiritimatiellia bacterium]